VSENTPESDPTVDPAHAGDIAGGYDWDGRCVLPECNIHHHHGGENFSD
jgi:hypothetical protein